MPLYLPMMWFFSSSKHEKSNNSKTHCDKTKKQQFVIKLKNLNCDKTQKANCDITQTQIVKTQNCDNILMQMVTKLKNSNCDKTQKL